MSLEYPYAHGPLLDDRQTYFYSDYQGLTFLKAWKNDRQTARISIAPAPAPNPMVRELPIPGANVVTANLLEAILTVVLRESELSNAAQFWLAQLIKKFEVTKRVHSGYDSTFKAIDREDHKNLELYLRLAEVLECAVNTNLALSSLNCMLKVMDTLCALRQGLSEVQRARLSRLVDSERQFVNIITQRVGVPLIA
ncbi:MAG: hypothetical protein CBB68_06740 [Rhodospirillaceae bacterium TMED8]|nr:hypothetical protein [Magnetovibrio sp.]MAH85462.1 hypothetical protein [Magnetovibrio sp.]OUT47966.1 MAG: hypothetical protein CBB68_14655 [Rhodospirillaceae bacterium TMED8]OUT51312.1 MAG: hypothetical protein CBB68_06740 [Rhodospirillaceae bacterium TMED8]